MYSTTELLGLAALAAAAMAARYVLIRVLGDWRTRA
jgi:hypothetical protein